MTIAELLNPLDLDRSNSLLTIIEFVNFMSQNNCSSYNIFYNILVNIMALVKGCYSTELATTDANPSRSNSTTRDSDKSCDSNLFTIHSDGELQSHPGQLDKGVAVNHGVDNTKEHGLNRDLCHTIKSPNNN